MDYWKMQELAQNMMDELTDYIGTSGLKRILRKSGLNAEKLVDMGFSESFLYGLGLTGEEVSVK